jgi:hypothetical protein
MDNSKRMAMTQAKGSGAPPNEPPGAPPEAQDPSGADDSSQGGMPDPATVIPQIAQALEQMAAQLPEQQKQAVMSAAQQLQAAFPSNSPDSGGMSAGDSEAYGEQPTG